MSASESHSALVLELAEEFLERCRQGQCPSLKEYIDRHPELAAEIKEVFPAMAMMENIALADDSLADATSGVASAPREAPPQQLGDYRILREIGRGGMGIVYEAEQVSLRRHVALKVLPRNVLLDDAQKRRFEREAKAAAKLHHTNIVPVFGVGEHEGLPYYVMQFIQGLGLDAVLEELKHLQGSAPSGERGCVSAPSGERGRVSAPCAGERGRVSAPSGVHGALTQPRSPESSAPADSFALSSSVKLPASRVKGKKASYWLSVANIGLQVAEALEHAHVQGIQHRDIKPSNLLLDTRGTVWITDFGLARADNEDHLTATGDIVGTLRYMPPEAFEGRADKRGDIYSLGLTLYELLARKAAFEDKDRNRLIKRVTMEEPARLDKLNRQVPRDLVTIVHKAIDREPSRRYATAGELAADLQRFIEDEPIHARRVSVVERIGRWYRHNPTLAALTATLVFVFLAGFIGIAWKWRDAERQKDIAQDAEGREAEQRIEAEAQAERSRRLLYAADMNLVGQAWDAGEIGRVRDLLDRQQPQTDLHGFEWRYLRNLCRDGSRLTLRGHTGPVSSVAFSPDGRTLVTIGQDQTVRLWDLASRQSVKLVIQAGYAAFSPGGKILALASRQEVRFWDVVAKCERANFMHPGGVNALAFSPDGKLLATCCWDQTIRIWNVATRQVDLLAGHSGPVWCFAFSPDGKVLASGSMDTTVRLWDVAARRVLTTCEGHLDWVRFLFFSPDGKTLSSASMDSVRLWDAVTGQPLKTLRKYRTEVVPTAFSPDGKTVATGDTAGMIRIWDVRMKGGTALLRGHFSAVLALSFSPDGRSLVSGGWDGTVKVWDVAPGPDPNILTGHKAWLSSLALSADGKTLAVGDADERENTVKLWDLASRRPSGILRGHKRAVHCLAFAPRGQVLATGSDDKTVRLWDVANKKQLHEFQHDASVYSVAFSPDGKFLAASNQNESALVWDLAAKQKVAQLSQAYRVRFSPDGKLLASAWHKTTRLWDVATWQNVATLEEKNPGGLPDRLGEAGEPESGAPGRRLQGDIMSLAFAPDGRTLATRDGGGILRLWDVAGKRQIASTRGHTLARLASSAGCVTYSPDGRRLATGGGDSLVKLWDADSLQEVATLTGHDGPVYGLAFTPDGNTLVTASGDSTVRLWQAPLLARIPRESADAPALAPIEIIRLFWLETYGTAAATRSVEGNSQRVDVTAVDDTNWHAMLMQRFGDLQEGATYTIRFRAKANAPRPLTVGGIIAEPDWHLIGLSETVSLTENWREYQCRFQAKGIAAANILQFIVGERKGTVWIADVTVTKGTK